MSPPAAGERAARRVVHVIAGLGDGGAEMVLARLVGADRGHEHVVVSLTDEGRHGPTLRAAGVAVHALGQRRGRFSPAAWLRLVRLLRALRPDVVQTWMYHADLLGGTAARAAGVRAVVWGVHSVGVDSPSTRLVVRLCALLSRLVPRRIVCVSQEGARLHGRLGYARDRLVVIPNGYDTAALAPDPAAREALRREWGCGPRTAVLGLLARWNVLKDHATLLAAFAGLAAPEGVDCRLVLAGGGMDGGNSELADLISRHGLTGRVALLGPRTDAAAVMSALDVHVLSSRVEAFPNVVAEAMCCGTPCVVTDVGDAALIVGRTGWVAPPGDPAALAAAMREALAERADADAWSRRRQAARERIVANFGLSTVVESYARLWSEVVG